MIELDDNHVYRVAGRQVPGVSEILRVLPAEDPFRFVKPEILRVKRLEGQHVHQTVDLWNAGELDETDLHPILEKKLGFWKKFLHETGFRVTHSEEKVHNRLLGYCGTLDNRGIWKKATWLLDLKNMNHIPDTVGPQTAAYREALEEKPQKRLVLLLTDTDYKLRDLTDPADWPHFVAALNVYRWRQRRLPKGESNVSEAAA